MCACVYLKPSKSGHAEVLGVTATHGGAADEDDDEGTDDPSDPHHPGHPEEQDHAEDVLDAGQVHAHQSAQLRSL